MTIPEIEASTSERSILVEVRSLLILLISTISVAMLTGVLWGLLRPAYGLIRQENSLSIDKETLSASYDGFLSLITVSAVMGLVIGILSFRHKAHSLFMMVYGAALALFAVYTTVLIGALTVYLTRSGGSAHDLSSVVPSVSPDLSFLVAGTMALTAYWMRSMMTL